MNEPVAWMDKRTNKCVVFINTPPSDDWIPLYTHSVKELTDEEILILWTSSNFVGYTENGHIDEIFFNKFARAILLKAQEK